MQANKLAFISLSTSNGTVVYGVEDGDDTSYEDILFCIDANPMKPFKTRTVRS